MNLQPIIDAAPETTLATAHCCDCDWESPTKQTPAPQASSNIQDIINHIIHHNHHIRLTSTQTYTMELTTEMWTGDYPYVRFDHKERANVGR